MGPKQLWCEYRLILRRVEKIAQLALDLEADLAKRMREVKS